MNAKEYLKQYKTNNQVGIIGYNAIIDLMEDYHTYKSKPKGKTLEERMKKFYYELNRNTGLYDYEMLKEFGDYWCEHGENDKKMRFEKEKSFGIKRRLATWKKNSKKWDTNKPVSLADKLKQDHGL